MGQFKLEIDAVGNHGCERDKQNGQSVVGCERPGCVDCMCRELIRRLKRSGTIMNSARLIHWPGTDGEIQDDLLTGVRSGSF